MARGEYPGPVFAQIGANQHWQENDGGSGMDTRMSARDLYARGRMLRQAKMYDLALADFRNAVQDPNYAGKAHTQAALCYRAMGRHGEAAAALRQALTSSALSPEEHLHVLYLLGQSLESLGRYAEALEAYGWVRQANTGFLDVDDRIKHLCAVGSGVSPSLLSRRLRSVAIYRYLHRSLSLLGWNPRTARAASEKEKARRTTRQETASARRNTPLAASGRPAVIQRNPLVERRYIRVGMRCRSQFASSTQVLAGEGELRDLSPGGCRLTSSVMVPVGAQLVCWIFPPNGIEPLTIEGATVRWSRAQEFGVAFAQLSPYLERQIARLCANPA
jgi:tetratricopeptide (TPR) repeat protein